MPMINLALPKSKKKKPMPIEGGMISGGPKYPYGLSITLNDKSLKKLGLDLKDFKVDGTVYIKCKCFVERLEETKDRYADGNSRSMGLQITDMDLKSGESAKAGFDEETGK